MRKAKFVSANRTDRDVLLGITGKDFTIIASSTAATRGATVLKTTDNKTAELNQHVLMAYTGEAGDTSTVEPRLNSCSNR